MNIRRLLCATRDRLSSNRTPRNSSPVVESLESRVLLDADIADWTVLVYMNADSDFSADVAALLDINEMEMVGSSSDVRIIAQLDFSNETTLPDPFGDYNTVRAEIAKDSDPQNYTSAPIFGGLKVYNPFPPPDGTFWGIQEVDMGDPYSLADFITWGMYNYTAKHYAVIIWDHSSGNGISGICQDSSNENDYLTVDEIGQALSAVYSFTGSKIDLIGFDSNMMGMTEVAYELAPYADVMVGAESAEPGTGWVYNQFLASLNSTPSMSAKQLGTRIVTSYETYYQNSRTLSAIDLNKFNGLTVALNTLVNETITNGTVNDYVKLQNFRNATPYFDDDPDYPLDRNFRDLGTFLQKIANDNIITQSIRNAAIDALDAYNDSIIRIVKNNGQPVEGGTGLSIYLPDAELGASSMYLHSGIDFAEETPWSTFLDWWDDMEAAGSVEGHVYDDANYDGVPQTDTESYLDDYCEVFLDTNGNGVYDASVTQTHINTKSKKIKDTATTSTIDVSNQVGVILDVNVKLKTTGTNLGNYIFTLISPTGQRILLGRNLPGATTSFNNTIFDDDAPEAINSPLAVAPYEDTFKPMGNLAYLNGLDPNGTWKLEVEDTEGIGGGTLWNWSLEIEVGDPITYWDPYNYGYYAFSTVAPGNYTVDIIDDPTADFSYSGVWGTSEEPTPVTVAYNQTSNVPLAAVNGGTVVGYVWNDVDGNGEIDAGEEGLEDFYVFSDSNNNGVRDLGEIYTLTESNGFYSLTGLYPGMEHTIRSLPVGGYHLVSSPAQDVFQVESGDIFGLDEYGFLTLDSGINFGYEDSWIYGVAGEETTVEDTSVTDHLVGLDPGDEPFKYELYTLPDHGTVTLDNNITGEFTYTPYPDFNGDDSFSFLCRGTNPGNENYPDYVSDPVVFTIHVTPVNDAPEVNLDNPPDDPKVEIIDGILTIHIDEDARTDLELFNYFSDVEATTMFGVEGSMHLTYELDLENMPQHGTVQIETDSLGVTTCYYTNDDRYYTDPELGSNWEPDSFRVRVVDKGDLFGTEERGLTSDYLTVKIIVDEKNDAPDCPDQFMTVAYEGNPLEFFLVGTDEETHTSDLVYSLNSDPVLLLYDPSLPQPEGVQDGTANAGRVDLDGGKATLYFSEKRIWENQYVKFTYTVTDKGIPVDPTADVLTYAEGKEPKTTIGTVYITLTPPEGVTVTVTSGFTAQYRDEDGSLVRVKVNNGNAVLFFAGQDISWAVGRNHTLEIMGSQTQLYDIQLVKSSLRTSINVTAKGGDGQATIGSIQGASVLGRFNGRCVNLTGQGVVMTGDGYIRNLYLGGVKSGADILMEGQGANMTMSLGAIETETIINLFTNDLKSFSAISWAGGSLTANSVRTLRITGAKNQAGNLNADITLTSQNKALNKVNVAGNISGTIVVGTVDQNKLGQEEENELPAMVATNGTSIGSIYAGSLNGMTLATGGGIGLVRTGNWKSGSLEAEWLRTLKINGNRRNAETGLLGADITLNGQYKGYSLHSAYVSNEITGGEWYLASSLKTLRTIGGSQAGWTVDKIVGNVGSILSNGTLDGNITIGGTAGMIRTTGTFAADMVVEGANAKGLSINRFQVGRSENANLTAANGGMGTIKAGEWLNGMIRTAYINSLRTTGGRGLSGDMTATINLENQNAKGLALGTARFAGNFDINSINRGVGAGELGPIYQGGKLIN